MDFQFAKAPAAGAAPVRLPQPNAPLRDARPLGLLRPQTAPRPAPTSPPHHRAEQARYQAKCRVAMFF